MISGNNRRRRSARLDHFKTRFIGREAETRARETEEKREKKGERARKKERTSLGRAQVMSIIKMV